MRRYLAALAAGGILLGACGGGAIVQPTPTATAQPSGGAQASTGGTSATAATATTQGGTK